LSESSRIKLDKAGKLLTFSGQKHWILLPETGSPGKAGNNPLELRKNQPVQMTAEKSLGDK